MKHRNLDQSGFIPLLLTILLIVAVAIYLIYARVVHAQH
jgi:hypothetical protein